MGRFFLWIQISKTMILKNEDVLKSFSRTPARQSGGPARMNQSGGDPDCVAHRDLRVKFPAARSELKNYFLCDTPSACGGGVH